MNRDIKIMVVDDDPDVLFATSRIVASMGYQVFKASSGAECRELAGKHHPDLILLDVVLPDTDGPVLCQELKSNPRFKDIFIILISGLKTSSDKQAEGLDVGADGYIARPISNHELRARINAMVRILKAERERDRLIIELKEALSKIKRLSRLLPFCSFCKKVRDDAGYWKEIDAYIMKHSDTEISHSICPECVQKHYPDLDI